MSDKIPNVNPDLGFSEDTKIRIITDGTTTIASIVRDGPWEQTRGQGVSRRRKGDKRREEIGTSIAVGRAFRDAAERIEKALNREGYTL